MRRYVPPVVLCESYSFEEAVLEPWQLAPVLEQLTHSELHRPNAQERLWHHKENVDKAVRVVEARSLA